jgi:dolichol-phosphate mannosyltransferase
LPALLAGMHGAADRPPVDVMIGSRYVRGGGIEGWPWRRYLMSWTVNQYARRVLRLPTRDCSGAYRCYRTSVLAQLDFSKVRGQGYSFQEEILWHLARAGARFGETPITFVERRYGESKVDAGEAVRTLGALLRLGVTSLVGR